MRKVLVRRLAYFGFALSMLSGIVSAQQTKVPETFIAQAEVVGKQAGIAASVTIQIDKYTEDRDRTAMLEALRINGYKGFLPVFRKSPVVGSIEANGRKVVARWARQNPTDKGGRTITVVTDGPLFFIGGGDVNAKPREGYELALLQIDVDSVGLGTGTMAAAARIKPGGATGVQVDDYAETPVKLTSVRKSFK